ncbi:P-loop containing nucleoside triphosphate hydrolase protein, partial [Blastocladiella britannica]
MRPFSFFRLDGSTERVLRQQYIDEFNTSPDAFAFVLSTRAGGVGINLTAADTVIIFDVDWNPHMDLQAIARAHRIGQKRPVLAYKFMTAQSAEEKMVAVGRTKLALDHVVV